MAREIIAIDCETDPFSKGRFVSPFIWGAYDGKKFQHWRKTEDFIAWLSNKNVIAYAHNGGKFDYTYLMKYVKRSRIKIIGSRMAEMTIGKAVLRDSFSIIPVGLGAIQKTKIEYSLFEKECRDDYMDSDIIPYLKDDCVYLFDVVQAFRKAAGTQLTIASNALKSSRSLGSDPGKTNFRFDRQFRAYYYGGRTECFQGGKHEGVSVVDIVSSYPFAMMQLHPSGDRRTQLESLEGLSDDEIGRAFIEIECYSAGAFPYKEIKRKGTYKIDNGDLDDDDYGALEFPHGKRLYRVTGWEYLTAMKHKLLSEIKIHTVTVFENTIDFSPYVIKWFEHKKNHPKNIDPINYTIGKIMMNSLYGKMGQNPATYFDYEVKDPLSPVDEENGWIRYSTHQDFELHRRSTTWNWANKYGVDWIKRPLFFNVATGASITGFARAKLLDAIHTVGADRVIYCDTDSLAVSGPGDLPLDFGKALGQWELEGKNGVGYFAGKKLYGIKFPDKEPKIASKGCKLTYDEIERVVNGEKITWESEAPTFSLAKGPHFIVRKIRATSPVSERKNVYVQDNHAYTAERGGKSEPQAP